MRRITGVSLFSGCGGFDLGVAKNGVDIVFANDNDSSAASAYKSLFPKTNFINNNIKAVKEFPQADILIGCYPCTGFSGGARRRWKSNLTRDLHQNDKNFLFEEFLRAIDIVKPKAIFIENVRGMLSADKGFFLKRQLQGFESKGFESVNIMSLNAANFGLAQTRHRVFFVGFHKDLGQLTYVQPKPTHGLSARKNYNTLRCIIGDMPEWPDGEFFNGKFHGHYLTRNRKRSWDEPSFTIVADGHHIPLHPSGEPMSFVSNDKWQINGRINRRLSWRECARIQGLPDDIDIDGSLLDKYRVIGNSVPPMLAEKVTKPAIKLLRSILR